MNNRNWIAVFLGLACLVLFVSVMGASGNWLNNNNTTRNNGNAVPQQISQTVRNMDNTAPKDGTLPTEINASEITEDITGNNTTSNNMSQNMPKISMPQITQ